MEALEVTLATVIEAMATCEYYSRIYKGVLDHIALASDATTEEFAKRVETALQNLYTAVRDFMDEAKKHFGSTSEIVYSNLALLDSVLDSSNHSIYC